MQMTLTKVQQRIIEILEGFKNNKGWASRADIASALNRPRTMLNYNDIKQLESLCDSNAIQKREVPIGTVKTRQEYKAK